MTAATFAFDRGRLVAAQRLPPGCFDEFQRLTKALVHGPVFQWLLIDARNELLRRDLLAALDEVLAAAGLRSTQLAFGDDMAGIPELEAQLIDRAATADVVHVLGRSGWFTPERWDAFNVRRERIAGRARARLVFWLDADAIALASRGAPDLWAWRGGVYAFEAPVPRGDGTAAVGSLSPRGAGPDTRSMRERSKRIAEIRAFLATDPPEELRVAPLHELGVLLRSIGDLDAALAHWRELQLPFHQARGDDRSVAITQGQIADVLQARGELDEALRIRREDELPVYEKLGDVQARAVTMGKIADVMQARGELDEALRIRRQDELPVYEKLGDVRSRAITMGQVADVLQARGELDEALRIRRGEELPVYEKLGDVRSRAITMGKIADVLQARGELDEALRIRREDQLPVYEKLSELRETAITEWKIARQLSDAAETAAAQPSYRRAYTALRSMRLPEAAQLAQEMRDRGVDVPSDT